MYIVIKRVLDIFLVLLTAPVWLPVMALLGVLVALTSKGPVFFTQKRYKKDCQFFVIYKFRSMYVDAPRDMPTHLLQNPEKMITPVGRILRKLSLDELPQLLNILKGDISIVGPRPALWNQDDLIAEREKYKANGVPVGLTGLAQINGRDTLSIEDKAAWDGKYVQQMGFFTDLKIIFLTVFYAITGDGVEQ